MPGLSTRLSKPVRNARQHPLTEQHADLATLIHDMPSDELDLVILLARWAKDLVKRVWLAQLVAAEADAAPVETHQHLTGRLSLRIVGRDDN